MLKTLSATALLSLVAATVTAGETYVGIGTTGLEVGWGQALSERSGIRIDAEFLSYKRNFSTNDTDYDINGAYLSDPDPAGFGSEK